MCEFISWIEVERDGEKHILYLTDQDAFSHYGRKKLEGCQDNDFLGHGAIRKFFGLASDEGINHEYQDFWNKKKLPKEIAEKIKNFNKHWGKMWGRCFQEDDLCYIVEYGNSYWKAKARKQLMKQKPDHDHLRHIIQYGTRPWKAKAAKQIMENPYREDLLFIIEFGDRPWKDKAWKRLMKRKPDNDALCYIIGYGPRSWQVKVMRQLLKQNPDKSDLCYCVSQIRSLSGKTRAMLEAAIEALSIDKRINL